NPKRLSLTMRPIPATCMSYKSYIYAYMVGTLPFLAVLIEVRYIFSSLWSSKFYYLYGFLFVSFIIYVILLLSNSIISTYLLLNNGNWKWQWFSFATGASSALYIFLFAVHYFYKYTE